MQKGLRILASVLVLCLIGSCGTIMAAPMTKGGQSPSEHLEFLDFPKIFKAGGYDTADYPDFKPEEIKLPKLVPDTGAFAEVNKAFGAFLKEELAFIFTPGMGDLANLTAEYRLYNDGKLLSLAVSLIGNDLVGHDFVATIDLEQDEVLDKEALAKRFDIADRLDLLIRETMYREGLAFALQIATPGIEYTTTNDASWSIGGTLKNYNEHPETAQIYLSPSGRLFLAFRQSITAQGGIRAYRVPLVMDQTVKDDRNPIYARLMNYLDCDSEPEVLAIRLFDVKKDDLGKTIQFDRADRLIALDRGLLEEEMPYPVILSEYDPWSEAMPDPTSFDETYYLLVPKSRYTALGIGNADDPETVFQPFGRLVFYAHALTDEGALSDRALYVYTKDGVHTIDLEDDRDEDLLLMIDKDLSAFEDKILNLFGDPLLQTLNRGRAQD